MRKAQYMFVRKLTKENESDALTFGSAIHKALEHWYTLPIQEREMNSKQRERADTLTNFHAEQESGSLESVRQFVLAAQPLKFLGEDKRSIENGISILKAYFKKYIDDGLEIVRDSENIPMVERQVSFQIYQDESVEIEYFGTIDAVMRNNFSGHIMVADHKTTAALGSQFYNRIRPNHQYTGYLWGARESLGIDTWLFLVNGIQVAKTKHEFARQVTERSQEDFDELRGAVIQATQSFLHSYNTGVYPQYAPAPCSSYGACQFLDVCSAPSGLRENIIQSKFGKQN